MSIIYQVDRSVTSSGKRVAVTKRRVRWQWGISNVHALATGATGAACRGSEHEVTLVWSIASGKRLVLFDGKEVTFSSGRRAEGKFECNWTAPNLGNYVLTIIAYAAAPLRDTPGFQQFDLIINGQSYSDMCRIYELGLHEEHATDRDLAVGTTIRYGEIIHPPTRKEEWQWAERVTKLEQNRGMNQVGPILPTRSHSLPNGSQQQIDWDVLPRSNSVPYSHDLRSESSATVNNVDASVSSFPMHSNHYHTVEGVEVNRNQPPSYETIWGTIMDAYDSNSTNQKDASFRLRTAPSLSQINPAVVNNTVDQFQPENIQIDSGSEIQIDGIHSNSGFLRIQTGHSNNDSKKLEAGDGKGICNKTAVKSPRSVSGTDDAMHNLDNIEEVSPADANHTIHTPQPETTRTNSESVQIQIDGIHSNNGFLHVQTGDTDNDSEDLQANMKGPCVVKSPRGVSEIDEAMQNLVNIEDILSPVFNIKLTMSPDHEKEIRDKRPITTQLHPPKMGPQGHFGRQLTLLELKHQQNSKQINPSKEIMKSHHCAVEEHTSAIVVYPQPQQYINYSHSYPYLS